MMREWRVLLLSLILFLLFPPLPILGVSGIYDRIGIIAEHGMHGAVPEENIDLFTGNLTLKFQDIVLPGPDGFDLVVWRVYNSKILRDRFPGSAWGMQQEPYSWVGWGWSMHMGRLYNYDNIYEVLVEFPDGRTMSMHKSINGSYCISQDFLKYDIQSQSLYFKDGTVWKFDIQNPKTVNYGGVVKQALVVKEIENPCGYKITIEYQGSSDPKLKRITDSMGRTVDFIVADNRLSRIEVKNAVGNTVKYYYTVEDFPFGGYYQLTKFEPPELPASTYEYNSGYYDHYELSAVNTSYGGRLEYEYDDQTFYFLIHPLETRVVKRKKIRFSPSGSFKTWDYFYPDYQNSDTGTVTAEGPDFNTKVTYYACSYSDPFNLGWKTGLMKKKWQTDGSYSEEIEWKGQQLPTNNQWFVILLYTNLGPIKAPLISKITKITQGDADITEEYWYGDVELDTGVTRNLAEYGMVADIAVYYNNKLEKINRFFYNFESNNDFKDRYMLSYITNETIYDIKSEFINNQWVDIWYLKKETITDYYNHPLQPNFGRVKQSKHWQQDNDYLTWNFDYTVSTPYPIDITKTVDLPGNGGTETHKYSYGVVSEIKRPGYTVPELSCTISEYNSAVLSETNQHGGTMSFNYDDLGRITKIDMPYEFNDINANWSTNSVTITQGGNSVSKYWDGMGRDTGYTESGDGTTLYYRKTLDAEDRLIAESKGSTDPAYKYQYEYNDSGKVTRILDPEGKETVISYSGNQKTVTDANARVTRFKYEALPGLATQVTDAMNNVAKYTYDDLGRLDIVDYNNNSRKHLFNYNGMDQLTYEYHPETGGMIYTYNLDNNLIKKNYGDTTINYQYNSANQLTRLDSGDEVTDYIYDDVTVKLPVFISA